MKILRICPEFYSEKKLIGLSGHLRNLSLALNEKSVEQVVLTDHSDVSQFNGIRIVKYESKWPFSQLRSGLSAFDKIKQMNEEFDLIHFHNHGLASIVLKKKQLPKMIMTLHCSPLDAKKNINIFNFRSSKEDFYFYYMSKFAAERVDAVVCVSPFVSKSLIEEWHLPEEKVKTITTAVDSDLFKPMKINKDIDILFVGRLVRKKQPLFLLKAVETIKESMPNIKVFLVGGTVTDELFEQTKLFIKQQDLAENVKLIEPVTQNKLCEYYNRSKLLVLPSLSESSPKVTLEAMACAIPVVTTNILGNKGITIDEETGFLVDKNDVQEFVDKLKTLLDDEKLCHCFGNNGRKRTVSYFSWEKKAEEYKKLYEDLIQS